MDRSLKKKYIFTILNFTICHCRILPALDLQHGFKLGYGLACDMKYFITGYVMYIFDILYICTIMKHYHGHCCTITNHTINVLCTHFIRKMTDLKWELPISCCAVNDSQTLVSFRRRFILWTLFSIAARFVISVAQPAGNQPLTPSLILSPWHQSTELQECLLKLWGGRDASSAHAIINIIHIITYLKWSLTLLSLQDYHHLSLL